MLIEVYSRKGCEYCVKAKKLLKNRNLPYTEYLVGEDLTIAETKSLFPGVTILPIIKVDGKYIGGFQQLLLILNK